MALRFLGLFESQRPPLPPPPSRILVCLACVLTLAAGCARRPRYNVEILPLVPEAAPPRPENCEVDILSAPPTGRYREIARVALAAPLGMAQGKVWELLRQTGCRAGGDALLITTDEVEVRTFPISGGPTLESRYRVIRALAIAYGP